MRAGICRWALAAALPLSALARAAPLDWSIDLLYGESEIYPSALVSVTDAAPFPPRLPDQLGDPTGLICARIVAPRDDCPVTVTVAPTEVFGESSLTVRLPRKGTAYRVAPRLALDHRRLLTLHYAIPAEWLRVRVNVDGQVESKLRTVRIHAINDCLMGVWMGREAFYTVFLTAAYVNEYDTALTSRVLRRALDRGSVAAFDGYDSGSRLAVQAQVRAIYDALHDLGCKYSSVARASLPTLTRRTVAQWIRQPNDALRSDQANCVDGTVLFASILTQLKIRAALFQIPGEHAFLGVHLTPDGETDDDIQAVDTVWVGTASYDEACRRGEAELDEIKSRAAEVVFSRASAGQNVLLDPPHHWFDFLRRRRPGAVFYRTDIAAARALGIVPLAESVEGLD